MVYRLARKTTSIMKTVTSNFETFKEELKMNINFGTLLKTAAVTAGALVGLSAIKKVNDYQTGTDEDDEPDDTLDTEEEAKEIETTGETKEEKKGK